MQTKSKLLFGDFETCKTPLLSILIPTYSRNQYLEDAIDSAVNQIGCSIEYEIIIVSNDPNDTMTSIIKKYECNKNLFIYQNEENIGMVKNSNRCVELARGKYIAFLHDDDLLLSNYLQVVEKYFLNKENEKAKCFITGRLMSFEEKDSGYKRALRKQVLRTIFFIPSLYRKKVRNMQIKYNLYANINCYFSPSCGTVIEKDVFHKIGGFNSNILYSWDYDFFLKLNRNYRISSCTISTAIYRIGKNASLRSEVKYDFFAFIRDNYLEFMRKNKIGKHYINLFEDEIIYSVFNQWPSELTQELNERGESIPYLRNRFKFYLFKAFTLVYYYVNNLDIQRVRLRRKKY